MKGIIIMSKVEKRKNYISWDEYFMAIAKLSAMRSKDPSTQVGACIVSNDNRILSIGYNGAPNGFDDEKFPWAREGKNLAYMTIENTAHLQGYATLEDAESSIR